jgi:ligand-binding SRPBCC domain-containing protein
MKIHRLKRTQLLRTDLDSAWDHLSSPLNLVKLMPGDLGLEVTSPPESRIYAGQIITCRIRILPGLWRTWVSEITAVDEGYSFVEEQRFGPCAFWHHRHLLETSKVGVVMTDVVHYALPGGALGDLVLGGWARRRLEAIFDHRYHLAEQRLTQAQPYQPPHPALVPLPSSELPEDHRLSS